MRAIRNEEYSIYYFLQNALSAYNVNIVLAYPYNEIQEETLRVPTISIGHSDTAEIGSELGGLPWRRRQWEINIFASNSSQRDELTEIIYGALENTIPIKDYTAGLPPAVGGQPTVSYIQVEDRNWHPITGFGEFNRLKFWRALLKFNAVSTIN